MALILDAGALVAVERADRDTIALIKRELAEDRALHPPGDAASAQRPAVSAGAGSYARPDDSQRSTSSTATPFRFAYDST